MMGSGSCEERQKKHNGGRRAIQLGVKGVTKFVNGTDILEIQDITPFVEDQRSRIE